MSNFLTSFKKRAGLIKEQYPSFKIWSDGQAIMLHQSIQDHQILREFIDPVNSDKVVQLIKNRFNVSVFIQASKGSRFVFVQPSLDLDLIENISKQMEAYNYYPAAYYMGDYMTKELPEKEDLEAGIRNRTELTIQFEPVKDTKITANQTLYHITPDFNWKKIRTLGLTPKTQAKLSNHPGRIYLINAIDKDDIEELAIALWERNPNKEYIQNMELLEIDTSKLVSHRFYEDPVFYFGEEGQAVYTYENIPPIAIKHVESILVNPTPQVR